MAQTNETINFLQLQHINVSQQQHINVSQPCLQGTPYASPTSTPICLPHSFQPVYEAPITCPVSNGPVVQAFLIWTVPVSPTHMMIPQNSNPLPNPRGHPVMVSPGFHENFSSSSSTSSFDSRS